MKVLAFTIRPAGTTSPLLRSESPEVAVATAREVLAQHGAVVLAAAGGGGGVARTYREIDRIVEALCVAAQRRGRKVQACA